jgi:hypothetical protein
VYDLRVTNCRFNVVPFDGGRGKVIAVYIPSVDGCVITNNTFDHCDRAVSGGSSYYDDPEKDEEDDYIDTESLIKILQFSDDLDKIERLDEFEHRLVIDNFGRIPTRRGGRNIVIDNNICLNSSEHCVYLSPGHHVTISNNSITTTKESKENDIKVGVRDCVVSGNLLKTKGTAINVTVNSKNVSVTGNSINCGAKAHGAIVVRHILAGGPDDPGYGIENVSIQGNSIKFSDSPVSNSLEHVGVWIASLPHSKETRSKHNPSRYTSDPFHPQIGNIVISNNSIQNCSIAFLLHGNLYSGISIVNNVVKGKPRFRGDDPDSLKSQHFLALEDERASVVADNDLCIDGNIIQGFQNLVGLVGKPDDKRGLAEQFNAQMTNNRLHAIKWLRERDDSGEISGGRKIRVTSHNVAEFLFQQNRGIYVHDREFAIGNQLAGSKLTNNSARQYSPWIDKFTDGKVYLVLHLDEEGGEVKRIEFDIE